MARGPDVESGFSKELTSKLSVTQIELKHASTPTKPLVRCQAQIEPVAARRSYLVDLTFVLNGVIGIV
jgi:hypothetical protein